MTCSKLYFSESADVFLYCQFCTIVRPPPWFASRCPLHTSQLCSCMYMILGCLHHIQVEWSVWLASIAPILLCHKLALHTLKFIQKVFDHPSQSFASWHPVWWDMTPVDITAQWMEDGLTVAVSNAAHSSHLSHHTWSLLNRFWTGLDHADLHRYNLSNSDVCECGQLQMMNQIVHVCLWTRCESWLQSLYVSSYSTLKWNVSSMLPLLPSELKN